MAKLLGRSGIEHEFSSASEESGYLTVIDEYTTPVGPTEMVKTRAKAYDVGAKDVRIIAPDFLEDARKLAKEYRYKLIKSE